MTDMFRTTVHTTEWWVDQYINQFKCTCKKCGSSKVQLLAKTEKTNLEDGQTLMTGRMKISCMECGETHESGTQQVYPAGCDI